MKSRMKVYKGFEEAFSVKCPVITIGTFDGVHIGHQKIINRLNEEAKRMGGESTLFTFYPHPRLVLYPESTNLRLLQTREEKIAKLERMGLQNMLIYPFTKEFSRMTATEFVRDILVNQMGAKKIVIGYDHQFGKNREGGLDFLRDVSETYGFEVIEIPAQDIEDVNVSSSKIRKALLAGDVETANKFLSEPYEINGQVVAGKEIGRTIGYPTANVQLDSELKLIPMNGVYSAEVELVDGSKRQAMVNIGVRPTLDDENQRSIEVHVLDFNADLYGQAIKVYFHQFVRDEIRFSNLEELKSQIKADEVAIRTYFSSTSV
jgi:riboflavin kinase/FMN adenylyltransferase